MNPQGWQAWPGPAVRPPSARPPMPTVQEGQNWNCQRVLSSRNNIVIDLDLCGASVPTRVVPAFVQGIADKIDAHS